MIKASLALFLMTLFLSSCQKNIGRKNLHEVISQQKEIELLQESVARLSDIPDVPLPVVIKKITYGQANSDQLQICCDIVGIDKAELYSYYDASMERLGWSLQASCDAEEGLLVFAKPSGSLCVISLRNDHRMVITMTEKKDLL